jgi:hypothetical protein
MPPINQTTVSIRDLASEYAAHSMSMDVRHAQMIGDFISKLDPCEVFEIGCYHGISTGEVLTTAKSRVHLVDYPRFQHNVLKMAELRDDGTGAKSVSLYACTGAHFLEECLKDIEVAPPGAVIILDGDHRWEVVEFELQMCFKLGFKRFVLHDVANPAGDCEGPAKALTVLQKAGFFLAVDQQYRPNERTERGLAICCKDINDYKLATEAVCASS